MAATYAQIMDRVAEIVRGIVVPFRPEERFREVPIGMEIDDHPGTGRRLFEVTPYPVTGLAEYVPPYYAVHQRIGVRIAYWYDYDHSSWSVCQRMAGTDCAYVASVLHSPPPALTFNDLASQWQLGEARIDMDTTEPRIDVVIICDVCYELQE